MAIKYDTSSTSLSDLEAYPIMVMPLGITLIYHILGKDSFGIMKILETLLALQKYGSPLNSDRITSHV